MGREGVKRHSGSCLYNSVGLSLNKFQRAEHHHPTKATTDISATCQAWSFPQHSRRAYLERPDLDFALLNGVDVLLVQHNHHGFGHELTCRRTTSPQLSLIKSHHSPEFLQHLERGESHHIATSRSILVASAVTLTVASAITLTGCMLLTMID